MGGTIQVFDLNSRAILRTWQEHKQPVWKARFSPDVLTSVMSVSDDQTVKLWDLPTAEAVSTFRGHTDYVRAGAFLSGAAGGQLIVSGSYDGSVRLWDARAADRAVMTFEHTAPVEDVLPMVTGTTILASANNQVSVLNLIASKVEKVLASSSENCYFTCIGFEVYASHHGRIRRPCQDIRDHGLECRGGCKVSVAHSVTWGLSLPGQSTMTHHLVVGLQSGHLSNQVAHYEGTAGEASREREADEGARRGYS